MKHRRTSNHGVVVSCHGHAIFSMRTKLAFVLGVRVFTDRGCWFPVAHFLSVTVFSGDLLSVMQLPSLCSVIP